MWSLEIARGQHIQRSGGGADGVLTNPDRENLRYTLRFEFKASDNEVEYEALIVTTRITGKKEREDRRSLISRNYVEIWFFPQILNPKEIRVLH